MKALFCFSFSLSKRHCYMCLFILWKINERYGSAILLVRLPPVRLLCVIRYSFFFLPIIQFWFGASFIASLNSSSSSMTPYFSKTRQKKYVQIVVTCVSVDQIGDAIYKKRRMNHLRL